MRQGLRFSLAGILMLAMAAPALAADRGPMRRGGFDGPPGGRRLLRLLESERARTELGLTDQQTDRLRQILVDAQKARIRARSDLGVRGIELREMLRAEQPNREAILKKVQEISELRAQMMRHNIETLLATREVLTPEQQEKIRSFAEQRRAGRGWRGDRGPDGPPRPGRRFGPRANPDGLPSVPEE